VLDHAVRVLKRSAPVAEAGCTLIRHLMMTAVPAPHNNVAASGVGLLTVRVAEKGGLQAAADAMRTHPLAAELQRHGCSLLCRVATDQSGVPGIADRVLEVGALALALDVMKNHSGNEEIQRHALELLYGLPYEARPAIIEAGGLVAVAAALTEHHRCRQSESNKNGNQGTDDDGADSDEFVQLGKNVTRWLLSKLGH